MDWNEVQKLYDQLVKSRRELAWLMLQNPNLRQIQDEATNSLALQLDALEAYVGPHRTAKED